MQKFQDQVDVARGNPISKDGITSERAAAAASAGAPPAVLSQVVLDDITPRQTFEQKQWQCAEEDAANRPSAGGIGPDDPTSPRLERIRGTGRSRQASRQASRANSRSASRAQSRSVSRTGSRNMDSRRAADADEGDDCGDLLQDQPASEARGGIFGRFTGRDTAEGRQCPTPGSAPSVGAQYGASEGTTRNSVSVRMFGSSKDAQQQIQ